MFWIFLGVTAVCATTLIYLGISPVLFAASEITLLLCMGLYVLYKKHHYTEAVEMINTTAANIADTQLRLVAFNEHLQALNDFTKNVSEKTDKAEICKLITRMLVNEFNYDSSQCWLLNPREKHLECISASGHNANTTSQLLANRGVQTEPQLLSQVLASRKMLIARNVNDHPEKEESDIYLFGKLFNLTSFVAAPLLIEDKAIGVLIAGYQSGTTIDADKRPASDFFSHPSYGKMARDDAKSFDEKDGMLLESITNFVSDAMVKIELFKDMEQQIAERTQQLTKINEELLRTKELAIQSEKLSSLGKMAAGVIHEINDPLNFLVNILPDLRRDLQGLEKVKDLTLECIAEPDAVSKIGAISEKYDLESHLQEMDFVFDRVTKALNKSTRIANSLNIFTSGSTQGETEMANLLEVAQDTIDMIPKKMLAGTKITVHAEKNCTWPVNRSEMQQVFINLINNAVDAMEKKGTIEILGEKKNHVVTISICDSGPGIPEEIQNQIFDPFFTTKPPGQSTGLGLSISAEIVHHFGGNLTVESKEGKGTCFHIRFREKTKNIK